MQGNVNMTRLIDNCAVGAFVSAVHHASSTYVCPDNRLHAVDTQDTKNVHVHLAED